MQHLCLLLGLIYLFYTRRRQMSWHTIDIESGKQALCPYCPFQFMRVSALFSLSISVCLSLLLVLPCLGTHIYEYQTIYVALIILNVNYTYCCQLKY